MFVEASAQSIGLPLAHSQTYSTIMQPSESSAPRLHWRGPPSPGDLPPLAGTLSPLDEPRLETKIRILAQPKDVTLNSVTAPKVEGGGRPAWESHQPPRPGSV